MPDKTPRLQVVSREGQHYIMVPTRWAGALRTYLQGRGLLVLPPQDVSTGISSLALGKKTDAKAVQRFLDLWGNCA
jgi:hypothetical protein